MGGGLSTDDGPGHMWTRAGDSGHLGDCPTREPLREDGQPDVGWPGVWDRRSAEESGQYFS
jgi:hypothetical protein